MSSFNTINAATVAIAQMVSPVTNGKILIVQIEIDW